MLGIIASDVLFCNINSKGTFLTCKHVYMYNIAYNVKFGQYQVGDMTTKYFMVIKANYAAGQQTVQKPFGREETEDDKRQMKMLGKQLGSEVSYV